MIVASALAAQSALVTLNARHFPMLGGVIVPYRKPWAPAAMKAGGERSLCRAAACRRSFAMSQSSRFLKPTAVERIFNRLFGAALSVGVGLGHNYRVEVKGRKSGKLYATPIDLLEVGGRRYLVAPRGETNWVRNARAAGGRVALSKGGRRDEFEAREIAAGERPALLKAYLDRFALTVQRYFPVPRGAPESEFVSIADRYPVFELIPAVGSPPAGGAGRG